MVSLKKIYMKDNKLSTKTLEELQKNKKFIKTITIMLISALSLLLILTIYITIIKGFTPLLIIPLALSPIVLLNLNSIRSIDKAIKLRENNSKK